MVPELSLSECAELQAWRLGVFGPAQADIIHELNIAAISPPYTDFFPHAT